MEQVIARLRPKLAQVPGGRLYLAAVQDLRAGGRQSNAQYQYTLQSDNVEDLYTWTPKLVDALEHNSIVTDVSSDQQQKGLESYLDIDRDTTARLGISPLQIDNTLYDAFGQRQVSVIYSAINQYHVVMEIDPRYTQYPNSLRDVYVATSGAARLPEPRQPMRRGKRSRRRPRMGPRQLRLLLHSLRSPRPRRPLRPIRRPVRALPLPRLLPRPARAARPQHQAHRQQHPPVPLRRAAPSPTRWPIPATAPHPPAQRSARLWKP